jgi:hypothetical protein
MKRERFRVTRVVVVSAIMTAIACLAAYAARSHAGEPAGGGKADNEARDEAGSASGAAAPAAPTKPAKPALKLPEPKGAKRLSPQYDVWIDPKKKVVIVDGQVSLREGMLEMFACTRHTKEHESIVSVNSKAFLIHAALLRLGAEQGRPVQFVPKYRPPSGTEIEVTVEWLDERGKPHTARAQDWIKDINTKKAMAHPFVFAGSSFWTDEETGKKFYQAEGGDLICVSNFGTAMLDIPVESSPENSELAFEAFTKRIPPLGAPVRLVLKPKVIKTGSQGQGTGSETEKKETPADDGKVPNNVHAPKSEKDETP